MKQTAESELKKLLYSTFHINDIYIAAAFGMSADVNFRKPDTVPKELSPAAFDEICRTHKRTDKTKIREFCKKADIILDKYNTYALKVCNSLSETESYAVMYLYYDCYC